MKSTTASRLPTGLGSLPAASISAPVLGSDPRPSPQGGEPISSAAPTLSLSHFKPETILFFLPHREHAKSQEAAGKSINSRVHDLRRRHGVIIILRSHLWRRILVRNSGKAHVVKKSAREETRSTHNQNER